MEEISEEELITLQDELLQHQAAVEEAHNRFKAQRQNQLNKRTQELQQRLKSLDGTIQENRQKRVDLRTSLADKKKNRHENIQEHMVFHQETWELERAHKLEEAAQRRLKLEKIQQKRKLMEKMLDSHMLHIDEIEAERKRRGQTEAEKLRNLLNRGNQLQEEFEAGEFDLEKVALQINHQNHEQETKNISQTFRLVDDIEALRQRKREEAEEERHAKISRINEERRKLMEEEELLKKKKIEMKILHSKGPEFLTDLELGHAPPKEFILKNTPSSEQETFTEPDDIEAIDKTIAEVHEFLSAGDKVIQSMNENLVKIEQEKQYGNIQPYEYKPYTYTSAERRICKLMLEVINQLIDDAVEKSEAETPLHQRLVEEKLWSDTAYALEVAEQDKTRSIAIHSVGTALLTDVIEELIRDIWEEVQSARQIISSFVEAAMINILLPPETQASDTVRNDTINSILHEMQAQRREKDNNISTRQMHKLSQKLILPVSKDLPSPKKKKKADKKAVAPEDPTIAPASEIGSINDDAKVIKIRDLPSPEEREPKQERRVKFEKSYFKNVKVTPRIIKYAHNISKCNSVQVSDNGEYLLAAGIKGELYVYDLAQEPPVVLRRIPTVPKSDRVGAEMMQWSWDNSSVAVMNQNKVISVWSTLPNDAAWVGNSSHSSSLFPEQDSSYSAPTVYPEFKVEASDLTRPVFDIDGIGADPLKKPKKKDNRKKAEEALEELTPTSICFFPGISLFGDQASILVGAENGTILKWNSQSSNKKYRYLYGKPVATIEAPVIADGTSKPKAAFKSRPSSIKREFFHSHRTTIIFIGFVDRVGLELVTVSKDGLICVWPYQEDYFTGFVWYKPSKKFAVDLRMKQEGTSKSKYRPGEVHQALNTPCGSKVVLMTFYAPLQKDQKPLLRFYTFDIQYEVLVPVFIEEIVVGSNLPQFALSRVFQGVNTECVFVLIQNSISIFSLATGKKVLSVINLIPKNYKPHPVTSISAGGNRKCVVAAAGESHEKLFCFEFEDFNTKVQQTKDAVSLYNPALPAELMLPQTTPKLDPADLNDVIRTILNECADEATKSKTQPSTT